MQVSFEIRRLTEREPFFNLAFFTRKQFEGCYLLLQVRAFHYLPVKCFISRSPAAVECFRKTERGILLCATGLIIRFRNNFERSPHVAVLGGGGRVSACTKVSANGKASLHFHFVNLNANSTNSFEVAFGIRQSHFIPASTGSTVLI